MSRGMLNILYLNVGRGFGGVEKRFSVLYKHLRSSSQAPYRAMFLISRAQTHFLPIYRESDLEHLKTVVFGLPYIETRYRALHLMFRLVDYIHCAYKIVTLMSFRMFDVVHFVQPASLFFYSILRFKKAVYSVVTSGNIDLEVDLLNRKNFLPRLAFDCLSDDIRGTILSSLPIQRTQTSVTPCSFIDYSHTEIGRKKKKLVFLSRFVPRKKGIESLLIPLIDKFEEIDNDVELDIIGFGALYKQVERAIAKSKGAGRIRLRTTLSPTETLKESLVFLSIQDIENYPSQSLLEAMACGNVIIATDVGLTRKLVNEENGILIRKDVDELIEAVNKIVRNEKQFKEVGEKNRPFVMKRHSVQFYVNYLQNEVYGSAPSTQLEHSCAE